MEGSAEAGWTLATWLALAAVMMAAVFGVGTIAATRRWGNRRRQIVFEAEVSPLLAAEVRDNLLEVTYRNVAVADPKLVLVRLRNVGPADIASAHFDGGRPLIVRLNCVFFGPTRCSHPGATTFGAVGSDGVVSFGPALLRRGDEWAFEALVSGDSSPELESTLIDTDVVDQGRYLDLAAEALSGAVLTLPGGLTLRAGFGRK